MNIMNSNTTHKTVLTMNILGGASLAVISTEDWRETASAVWRLPSFHRRFYVTSFPQAHASCCKAFQCLECGPCCRSSLANYAEVCGAAATGALPRQSSLLNMLLWYWTAPFSAWKQANGRWWFNWVLSSFRQLEMGHGRNRSNKLLRYDGRAVNPAWQKHLVPRKSKSMWWEQLKSNCLSVWWSTPGNQYDLKKGRGLPELQQQPKSPACSYFWPPWLKYLI